MILIKTGKGADHPVAGSSSSAGGKSTSMSASRRATGLPVPLHTNLYVWLKSVFHDESMGGPKYVSATKAHLKVGNRSHFRLVRVWVKLCYTTLHPYFLQENLGKVCYYLYLKGFEFSNVKSNFNLNTRLQSISGMLWDRKSLLSPTLNHASKD